MNKKGMLATIISGFIVIFVGLQLFGIVSQEVDNQMNCNIINMSNEEPIGKTDSFGGAGSGQFGGYDGKIHKSWASELSLYKTNKSVLNQNCKELSGASKTFLELVPLLFGLSIFCTGLGIAFNGLKNAGLIIKKKRKNE